MIDLAYHTCNEIREVTLHYTNNLTDALPNPSRYYMLSSQVETFLKATIELHYEPGINPHNGVKAATLWMVTVGLLEKPVSYWWCVPGLSGNHHPDGAQVSSFVGKNVWMHPALAELLREERAEEERAEYEADMGEEPQRAETD